MRFLIALSVMFLALLAAAGELKITVLSDIHVSPGIPNDKLLARAVDEINSGDADLVVVTGDLTNRGADFELKHVHKVLSGIKKPLRVLPGNHETNWSESATQTFNRLWGSDRFAETRDGVVMIGFSTGPYLKMGDGYVRSEDVAFLKESLKKLASNGEPVLIFCHYPLADELGNGAEIAAILRNYNVRALICGHTHSQCRRMIYGIDHIICRALSKDGTEGYNLLRIDNAGKVDMFEKRLGGDTLPVEQRKPISETPFPVEEPLPPNVKVELLHTDAASVFTGAEVTGDAIVYGSSDGRLVGLTLDGKAAWTLPVGAALYSTPCAIDAAPGGKEYFVVGTINKGLLVYDPESGKQVTIESRAPMLNSATRGNHAFYIGMGAKEFHKYWKQGALAWKWEGNSGTFQGRPAIKDGIVIFGAWDTNLYALNDADGKLLWKWNNGKSQVLFSPGNVNPVIGNGQVIIVAPDRYMTAIDLKTGKQVWRDNSVKYREAIGGSADGSTVYAKTMDGELVAVPTGKAEFMPLWKTDLKFGYEHAPCPVLESDGIVYAGSRNGVIAAVDAESGKLLWRFRGGNSAVNDFTRGPDGRIYATLIEGKLYRITNAR